MSTHTHTHSLTSDFKDQLRKYKVLIIQICEGHAKFYTDFHGMKNNVECETL